MYRAIEERGQVLHFLFREHRDTEPAEAFFRRTLEAVGTTPTILISDQHQPYLKAVQEVFPKATHVLNGLHRASGEATKPIERSHIATHDRLRSSRGLKSLLTGQRFFGRFEALQVLRYDHAHWQDLAPHSQHLPAGATPQATPHDQARAVIIAWHALGARLTRVA